MPRGDKSKYTDKQKRQAEHIAEGYEDRGLSEKEAESRAWATVNATDHGGKKSGSGRGKAKNPEPAKKGGEKGGKASAARSVGLCTQGCGDAETECREVCELKGNRTLEHSARPCAGGWAPIPGKELATARENPHDQM